MTTTGGLLVTGLSAYACARCGFVPLCREDRASCPVCKTCLPCSLRERGVFKDAAPQLSVEHLIVELRKEAPSSRSVPS